MKLLSVTYIGLKAMAIMKQAVHLRAQIMQFYFFLAKFNSLVCY